MLLVTGGCTDNYCNYYVDSTELLVPGSGSWRLATGLLPRPMVDVRVATVDNKVFLTGENMIIIIVVMVTCNNAHIQVAML